jgi:ABC-type amino acid transport substrate-binding protein
MLRRFLHLSAVVTLAFAAASLPAAAEETAGPAAIAPAPRPKAAQALLEARFDGWDGMVAARAIRVLVAPNQTHFFLDGARQRGIIAEALHELEKDLNRQLGLGARRLHVIPIPVSRGELIPYLEQGRGDVAAANLTITPEREKRVDFTRPISNAIDEVVVTGPRGPVLARLDDLSGQPSTSVDRAASGPTSRR